MVSSRLGSRRSFLAISALFLIMPLKALAALWNKAAFEAKSVDDVAKNLNISKIQLSNHLEISLPSRAENGAIVQLEVISHLPKTTVLAVLVPNNPTALIMSVRFSDDAVPRFITRIKMAETSAVEVIAQSGEQYFKASRQVEVLENGCSGSGAGNETFESSTKMRAKLMPTPNADNIAELKTIITHPMLTGYAKDESGNTIAALFIQTVTITLNDQVVIDMQLGTGISKNPYFTFQIANAKLNDTVKLIWSDNKGNTGKGEAQVIS